MNNGNKHPYDWFFNKVFGEESIRPRFYEDPEALPSTLRAARSLERGMPAHAQSRSALFVKQAKLLANYEDTYVHEPSVLCYYPTYRDLSDPEPRGYFTWRTALRRGDLQKTHLTYAFLHIYELLNLAGPETPEDGYRQLTAFRTNYGALDNRVISYLNRWITDFIVYHRLDPKLLADSPEVLHHNSVSVFASLPDRSDEELLEALKILAPAWLKRSKFYRDHPKEMDAVLVRVLRKVYAHYSGGKRTMVEIFCGPRVTTPMHLFDGAVFNSRAKKSEAVYRPDDSRVFTCKNGLWYAEQNLCNECSTQKLEGLVKSVDALMRPHWGNNYSIQKPTDTKWLNTLIEKEIRAVLELQRAEAEAASRQAAEAARKAAEENRFRFDRSRLDAIRRDSEITRDKLIVDEEQEELPPELPAEPASHTPPTPTDPETASPPADSPLPPEEYRLLQSLLYGGSLDWIRQEGLMLSVLTDSVNDILYDTFSDTVLTSEEPPELIEDYIEELKEMVKP